MTRKPSLVAILVLSFNVFVRAQFTCSPSQPCEIGCCTKFGSCGLGPDSCGPANCISNCDRKSECDPGWGPKWSTKQSCPLKVCCSKYGFCGTTSEFCGSTTVAAPSCSGSTSSKRTIGYYESWAIGRPCDRMYPEGIPIGAYTHLNFAFAFIHPTTFAVAPMSPSDPKLYTRFTSLKNTHPGLQTWISIGGWSMNDPDQPTAATFSNLAGSSDAQSKFFESVLSFLETYGFDGVDLDWEYPVAPERSGKPSDYANLVTFLQNFRIALHSSGHNYGLTITIPSSFWYLQHFDVVSIEKTIDWFNLMSYDLHGTWDSTNKFLGAYIAAHTNLTEIDDALSLLWRNNINPDNVVLGIGFYGRSFTLADPSCTTAGCVFTSGARAGTCTQSVGTLSYAEIERIVARGAKVIKDDIAGVKMVVYDTDQWVSYDDAETLKMKVDYANAHCLGGTMVWAVSTDDLKGSAANALSLSTGRQAVSLLSNTEPDPLVMCQLGECGQSCPVGLSPAQRSDSGGKGNTGTDTGCPPGVSRLYCCPSDDMPTCTWRGEAPFCGAKGKNKCTDNEVEVTSSIWGTGEACWTSHKVLCCTKTASNSAASQCQWRGSAPSCDSQCPSPQLALVRTNSGAGGEQPCFSGFKSFCCDQPPPYTGCDWYGQTSPFAPRCTGTCPAGKAVVASSSSGCYFGSRVFCCDNHSNDPALEDFKRLLSTFADDPTCKVGQRQHSRRATGPTKLSRSQTNDLNDLEKRTSLSPADLANLVLQISQITGRSGVQTYSQNLMAGQFDEIYGSRHGLHVADVSTFSNEWPNTDQLVIAESLMCMGDRAHDYVTHYHEIQEDICVDPCEVIHKRGVMPSMHSSDPTTPRVNKTSLLARNLAWSADANERSADDEPSWGLMMGGIMAGLMTFEYEQIIRTSRDDTILEIVWRLPEIHDVLGGTIINPDYQDFNADDADTNPDRFIVFHFHTAHLAIVAGAQRPGITAVTAFHGQNRYRGRVDGNDRDGGRNTRAPVMRCDPPRYFYPGQFSNQDALHFPEPFQMMIWFSNYLVTQRLLTATTYTGWDHGQLGLEPLGDCTVRGFDWGRYYSSRRFGPGGRFDWAGATQPPLDTVPQEDNDGV